MAATGVSSIATANSWNPMFYVEKRQYRDSYASGLPLMKNRLQVARSLFRKDLFSHYGCVNAIEFFPHGEWLVSGGDDRRVLVWNVEKALHGSGSPVLMKGEHGSNIFCLGIDSDGKNIFSAGNDEQVVVHDFETGSTLDVFLHEEAVYGLSIEPLNDNVFASACEDGRVLIWDIREPSSTEPFCLASYSSAFHSVMYNPVEPRLVATANSKQGLALWDVRAPRKSCLVKYGGTSTNESCMSVRFNRAGTHLLALRRRLPPVLFSLQNNGPECQFDHHEYYNSCTMKSCCFAGDRDQYILSGSDDFNLYMWKIPDDNLKVKWVKDAHLVLKGHRSIVNQVRFNPSNFLLASSGVEKIIKLWSPFCIPGAKGDLNIKNTNSDQERKVYSHEEYISLILQSGQVMSHDYSHKSTSEDPRMMAFFDSLVQREIEGWNSDSSQSSSAVAENMHDVESDSSSSSSGENSTDSSSSSFDESGNGGGGMGINGLGFSPVAETYAQALVSGYDLHADAAEAADASSDVAAAGDDAANGEQSTSTGNRISQLIAQKRWQMMMSVKLKLMKSKQSSRLRKLLAVRKTDTTTTNNGEIGENNDTSSDDSDDDKTAVIGGDKKVTERGKRVKKEDVRKSSRHHKRVKLALGDTESSDDDDVSSKRLLPSSSSTSARRDKSGNADAEKCSHSCSSSQQEPSTSDNYKSKPYISGTSESSDDDGETKGESGGSTKDGGGSTPDSGISTSEMTETNAVVVDTSSDWTQFKRIRSRLQRECRNYRSRSNHDEPADLQ